MIFYSKKSIEDVVRQAFVDRSLERCSNCKAQQTKIKVLEAKLKALEKKVDAYYGSPDKEVMKYIVLGEEELEKYRAGKKASEKRSKKSAE